jgi:hypothetical protein
MVEIKRKSDRIKFIDTTSITSSGRDRLQCRHCPMRGELVQTVDDPSKYRCRECGQVTPAKEIRRERSIQRPAITRQYQNEPMIYQSSNIVRGRDRRPDSMVKRQHQNAAVEWIQARGFEVLDSTSEDRDSS